MKRHRPRVSSTGQTLLNLGCGARFHPEWNNLDFVPSGKDVTRHNILSGLPYADASFDAVYSAHFLEHLSPGQVRFVLGEILRTLKAQGVVRVVVPDLEYNARLYLESLQAAQSAPTPATAEHYEWASLNLIDQMVRERPGGALGAFLAKVHVDPDFIRATIAGPEYDLFQQAASAPEPGAIAFIKQRVRNLLKRHFHSSGELHKWMYDSFSLSKLLREIGFVNLRRVEPAQSDIPGFARYLLDRDAAGAVSKPNSLFMEGRKAVTRGIPGSPDHSLSAF